MKRHFLCEGTEIREKAFVWIKSGFTLRENLLWRLNCVLFDGLKKIKLNFEYDFLNFFQIVVFVFHLLFFVLYTISLSFSFIFASISNFESFLFFFLFFSLIAL